jgi:hypothetical protein
MRDADATRDPDATREIVAVSPEDGYGLDEQWLGDRRSDLRVIGMDPQTGNVILDAPDARLEPLAKKVAEYEDPARVSRKTGRRRTKQLSVRSRPSTWQALDDLIGPRLRADPPAPGEPRWFELGCRGGRRRPDEETASSRAQALESGTGSSMRNTRGASRADLIRCRRRRMLPRSCCWTPVSAAPIPSAPRRAHRRFGFARRRLAGRPASSWDRNGRGGSLRRPASANLC